MQLYNYIKSQYENNHIIYNSSITIFVYLSCFPILNYFLMSVSENYRNSNKKQYIQANLLKSGVLVLLSYIFVLLNLKENILSIKSWKDHTLFMKNFSILYAITDTSGFLCRVKMQMTTVLHHIAVIIASYYICSSDLDNFESRGIITYGGFASLAFVVNFFLAARYLEIPYKKELAKTSFIVYLSTCSLNWGYQFFAILEHISKIKTRIELFKLTIYCIILYCWIKDDIVLMKYLRNYK